MQALSSSQTSSNNSSPDESIEHNGNGLADPCEGATESSSSCSSQVDNSSSQHINNNTIAINNNNCDTTKNNNQTVTATAAPLDMVNELEAVPAVALIEQQSALLRSVNIGM
jgi:hypothetical protein